MDKGAKDKVAGSPGENGGHDAQNDFHLRNGRDETKRKTQERMERRSRDLQVLGVRRCRELVTDRGKKWRGIVRQVKAYSGL
jgi:hypothetical protein